MVYRRPDWLLAIWTITIQQCRIYTIPSTVEQQLKFEHISCEYLCADEIWNIRIRQRTYSTPAGR